MSPRPNPVVIALALTVAPSCVTVPQSSEQASGKPLGKPVGVLSHQVIPLTEPQEALSGLAGGPKGVRFSPGSGLAFVSKDKNRLQFLYVTDRGPNAEPHADPETGLWKGGLSPELAARAKVFPLPEFAPRFGTLEVDVGAGTARVVDARSFRHEGRTLSGRPLPQGTGSADGEIGLNAAGQAIPGDVKGVDPEGIVRWGQDALLVSEEYRPSVLKVRQKDGFVEEWWTPGKGLPEIFAQRRLNRGFEAVTVTPSGAWVAMLQSTLDLGKTKDAFFIRGMVRTGETVRQFAFPLDDRFSSRADAKIGDLVALGDDTFAVIVQGKVKSNKAGASDAKAGDRIEAFLQVFKLGTSCDPGKVKASDGRELEFVTRAEEFRARCAPVEVKDVIRLADLGWRHSKTEGLALVDESSVAIINDNDFGVGEDGPEAPTEILMIRFQKPLRSLL